MVLNLCEGTSAKNCESKTPAKIVILQLTNKLLSNQLQKLHVQTTAKFNTEYKSTACREQIQCKSTCKLNLSCLLCQSTVRT